MSFISKHISVTHKCHLEAHFNSFQFKNQSLAICMMTLFINKSSVVTYSMYKGLRKLLLRFDINDKDYVNKIEI